ncbi:MAG TPA: DnaJ domain-containing protein [Stellaceae bacterium]|nr:DnaJ domain-containing protein [Stellaceae bacterium]
MLFLLGGVAILCGLLLLVYVFVNADPARLARGLKWAAIGVAVLAVAALAISGRLTLLLTPVALLLPLLGRLRSVFGGFRSPSTGKTSTVASEFLRMTLDHDTGTMSGTVLRGRFSGMRLEELGRDELLALLRECRASDEDGARLLEAYLDRCHPDWRDNIGGEHGGGRPAAGPDITVEEAYAILGLSPGADAAAIKEAHHRLMMKLHPDHGGTDYLATKINRARDVLLHR